MIIRDDGYGALVTRNPVDGKPKRWLGGIGEVYRATDTKIAGTVQMKLGVWTLSCAALTGKPDAGEPPVRTGFALLPGRSYLLTAR